MHNIITLVCLWMQWNAPLLLMGLKIAPAIVAGNAVVVKSSELAPLGTLLISQSN